MAAVRVQHALKVRDAIALLLGGGFERILGRYVVSDAGIRVGESYALAERDWFEFHASRWA